MLLTQFLQAREENKLEQHRGKGQKKQGSGSPNGAAKTLKERLSRENTLSEHSLKGGSKWRAVQRESSQSLAKAGSNPWSVQAAAAPRRRVAHEGEELGSHEVVLGEADLGGTYHAEPEDSTRARPGARRWAPSGLDGRVCGANAAIVARMQVLSNQPMLRIAAAS